MSDLPADRKAHLHSSEAAHISILLQQGVAAHEQDKLDEARFFYEQVLVEQRYNFDALQLLGLIHFSQGSYEKALHYHLQAVQQNPSNPIVHHNIGNVLAELGRLEEAIFSFDTCLALDPDNADVHKNKGITLEELGRDEEALACYDRAIACNPRDADAYYNRGNVLKRFHRFSEAVDSQDNAIDIDPQHNSAYWNKAILLLLLGDYLEGWSLYEWRSKGDDAPAKFPSFSQPSWRGEFDISGKRLLIHAEQGFGDLIQFSRYVPMILSKGAEVILEVPKPLVTVMQTLHPEVAIAVQGERLPEFDFHCPVMSLPYVFKTTVETVPSSDRYLSSDPAKVALWQEKLGATSAKRVGLVWSGSATHKNDHNRSIALTDLLPLLDTPCEWHSLQKEYREGDLAVLEDIPQLRQHQDDLIDFSDTAALIECLDLVITVDTSVAHLAGALGKPVWILVPRMPCYRWLLDRTDTPWYPSAQLFRQSEAGDWRDVLTEVEDALRSDAGPVAMLVSDPSLGGQPSARSDSEDASIALLVQQGLMAHQLNQLDEAKSLYEQVLAKDSANVSALELLGLIHFSQCNYEQALYYYLEAVQKNPSNPIIHHNIGNVLADLGRLEEAIFSFDTCLTLDPNNAEVYKNKANALYELHCFESALEAYDQVLSLGLDDPSVYATRGAVLSKLDRDEEALANYGIAESKGNLSAQGYHNLGGVLGSLGCIDAALDSYNRAISLRSDYQSAHWNKALLLLLRGEYLEGWSLYEWRSKGDDAPVKFPSFSQPSWRGEFDISGKRLLIHAEQGFGDLIQFSRYVPMILSKGAEVILEVPKPLVTVMQTLHPEVAIAVQGERLPEFDFHCPVMSLPYVFKTTVETVPSSDCYVSADPAKVALWQEKLGATSAKRVGLVWSGRAAHKNDHNRSIALTDLLPLLDTPCEWHSLQKEYREGDLAVLEDIPQLRQHQDDLIDFSDTAALIECLDLVITVDTSVAHLAGALGKPVWILVPALHDFRWLLDRTDTPWYPSAQLFRQSEAGEWEPTIRDLIGLLESEGVYAKLNTTEALNLEGISKDPAAKATEAILLAKAWALHRSNEAQRAQCLYEYILHINSEHFDALRLVASLYAGREDHESAIEFFEKALKICQTDASVYLNQGASLRALGRLQEAINSYTGALQIRPDYAQAHCNLGNIFKQLENYEAALTSYQTAIRYEPTNINTLLNHGLTLGGLHRYEEALTQFNKVIDLKPDEYEGYGYRGSVLHSMGRLDDALFAYCKALELAGVSDEGLDYIRLNKGILLLLRGEYLEGWSLYEWRSKGDDAPAKFPSFSQPSWRGEFDISGKRLLIHAEQGFGDLIQFSRYVPMILSKGAEVILEVPKPLVTVMQTLHPEVAIAVQGERLPEFDFHCPVMSLPYVFKTTVETVPSSDRYLSSDPAKVALWQEKLGATSAKRVGLVWSGSATHKNDHNRSIALTDLLPLLDTPCEWHSLQKEYREGDLAVLEDIPQLHQHQDDLIDFSDTAALIECLDLVITVDTSVAHLAGALGKPVWILVPALHDFRWLLDRTDTPWYPSAQLFRQSEAGDWRDVLTEVEDALRSDAGPVAMLVSDPSLGGQPSARSDSEDASIALLVQQGLMAHQLNQLDEAKSLYEQVLAKDSANVSALELLGLIHFSQCNYEQALYYYLEAVQKNPSNPIIHHNIGNVLADLGRLEEAIFSFDTCLTLDPNNAEVYKNKGTTLEGLGRDEDALFAYKQAEALNPNDAEIAHYQCTVLTNLGQLSEALGACNKALSIKSAFPEAHYSRGNIFSELGQHENAELEYATATSLDPSFAKAYKKHGDALLNLKRDAKALQSFEKACALGLETPQLYTNRAAVLNNLKRFDDSLMSAERAIKLDPTYSPAWTNHGVALKHLDRFDDALKSLRTAAEIKPKDADCHYNLGTVFEAMGDIDAALDSYNRAISLRSDYQSAHWNKALLLLLRGEYLEGWSLYEWRSKGDDAPVKFPSFSQPSWRGEFDISGKRLLIHAEQGFGDLIQFSRYVPMILSKGAEVILEVPKPLVTVMQTLHPEVAIAVQGERLPEFDFHCPVMSLPYVFKTTVETVPSSDCYVSADPAKVALWQEKLGATSAKRVGLVWSGRAAHKNDHNRSIALTDLLPLLDTPCEWHSLQKEYREGDLAVLEDIPQLHQHQDDLIDFSDTAALIECLDLVITVDTSVAHLAGALGKPVWILVPALHDFRWLLDRTDTPWYPSAQLFRQSEAGEWEPTILRVIDRFTGMVGL